MTLEKVQLKAKQSYMLEFIIKQLIRQQLSSMGQQISLQPECEGKHQQEKQKHGQNHNQKEGLVRISQNPFPNSMIMGQRNGESVLYSQKCTSLHQWLNRRRQQGGFLQRKQVLNLIQSCVYTLAGLEQGRIIYRDLNLENMFVVSQKGRFSASQLRFKLLPNKLVRLTTYQRLLCLARGVATQSDCFNFSPEMIIAMRARQKTFKDQSLLKKSSVFSLGMLFLESATLCQSSQFYDIQSFDIYEQVIESNLSQIQLRYGDLIAKFIANMLDFDYQERLGSFSQFAKWMIYQIQNDTYPLEQTQGKSVHQLQQQPLTLFKGQKSRNERSHEIIKQMIPLCMQKKSDRNNRLKIPIKNSKSQVHSQDIQKTNKILIKQRQVSVYFQKKIQSLAEKQNSSRLLYSPFLDSFRQNRQKNCKQTCSELYQKKGQNWQKNTRRALAFDQNACSQKNTHKQSNVRLNSIFTERSKYS